MISRKNIGYYIIDRSYMARSYDNWERLVRATLREEDLRLIALRTTSESSSGSLSPSSSFNLISLSRRVSSFNSSSLLIGDSFSYHQILRATDNLTESNLIKRGHSGDLFYGVLERGTRVVVKKIDLSSVNKDSLLISELEFLGNVSHYRLVPLIGHCFENEDEKFLVYKNMPNKDLSTSLTRKIASGNGTKLPFLDWMTRLKIAIEAAETLSYLHDKRAPPLVHGDIKSSSIFLDDKFEVRLGSLYKVCAEQKDIGLGSFPGTSNPSYATCVEDVYSFGKVLLELVTGRQGFSAVNDSTTEDWMEIVLAYILPDRQQLIEDIADSSLIIDEHVLHEVWAISFIAKACLNPESSKRPRMAQIHMALQHIKQARFVKPADHRGSDNGCIATAKLILKKHGIVGWTPNRNDGASRNHETSSTQEVYPIEEIFDRRILDIESYSLLKVAVKNVGSDPVVRGVDFGKAFQVCLRDESMSKGGNGSLVAVRRLHSRDRKLLKDWQSRVRLLGRLSHPNVVKCLGYSLEHNELFIIDEFIPSGSLENHLFRTESYAQPLSWDTRLKILIGAARGLAFLHAVECRGLYEYFDISDILLDSSYRAKVTGFGMGKIPLPDVGNEVHPHVYKRIHGYTPPQFILPSTDIPKGFMSMESDVYGFGVVIVEMLTGLSAEGTYMLGKRGCRLVQSFRFHMHRGKNQNQLEKIMDPQLEGKYPSKAAVEIGALAMSCVQYEPMSRPSMKKVLELLELIGSSREATKGA